MRTNLNNSLHSVNKALLILETLSEQPYEYNCTQLSKKLGIPRTTTYRLIKTLKQKGFVLETNKKNYALGQKTLHLGASMLARMDIHKVAYPYLEELSTRTKESASLSIYSDDNVIQIDNVSVSHPYKLNLSPGSHLPLHASAPGKVFLADMPQDILLKKLQSKKLHKFTLLTKTNLHELVEEISMVRRKGYAIEDGEFLEGIGSIAAPILNYKNEICAAISLFFPMSDKNKSNINLFASLVKEKALEISVALGCSSLNSSTDNLFLCGPFEKSEVYQAPELAILNMKKEALNKLTEKESLLVKKTSDEIRDHEKDLIKKIYTSVWRIKKEEVNLLIKEALDKGINPTLILEQGIANGVKEAGRKFENAEYSLLEISEVTDITEMAIKIINSEISNFKWRSAGRVVIGTVKGDIHDIGKNLASCFLKISGFEVHDLGVDVKAMDFIQMAEEVKADVIALSSLMLTTMPNQAEVIRYLIDLGLREKYIVVIGGGPTTKQWADQIGADGWVRKASEGADVIKLLIQQKAPTLR